MNGLEGSAPIGRSGDTIFAVASGAGRAAVAILRLTGPASGAIVKAVAGRLPPPRVATLATFRDPATGEAIDQGLVIFFQGPRSYTGEDSAEFHIHGGRAVVAGLIAAIGSFEGARAAEAGEFSRRALMNGKLDLGQIEGIGDLVAAETASQRRQALRQTAGMLGRRAGGWRAALIEASARIAADIDFSDEGDVAAAPALDIAPIIAPVLAELRGELHAARAGERIREGLTIVIAGPPNAGKSTLLNALARRDVAIVSKHAGTTRDVLEVELDLGGYAAVLIDTAGLRETTDPVEQIGVSRALERAQNADLVLWLSELGDFQAPDARLTDAELWQVATKADLAPSAQAEAALCISAASGLNLDVLLDRLAQFAAEAGGAGHDGVITRERHRKSIAEAESALARILSDSAPVEIVAEDLRAALFALERLVGRVDVEDILGDIFSRFCIGK
ncbi:tRNA modification GTPase TrmE [Methylocella silvestris BL2]|uniref:tRNA modification GTPase MnmE n=1 Tax=Methylocella silvestris (strain DSM 15510 / CIP 108128 / LMG 27833 / NCIMB 13906 / BL2) TaxID=395965 RepID=B8EQ20_METSB|nr:tRNA uridine-5-carboxymethylaminomethyl(34) synthesis GTPase MnmE [Methylocella silvestris]ACK51510.1 tRNA modification GTPase TrmE [Methylocella silvestris BL2]